MQPLFVGGIAKKLLFLLFRFFLDSVADEECVDCWLLSAETLVEHHWRFCAATAKHVVLPRFGNFLVKDAVVLFCFYLEFRNKNANFAVAKIFYCADLYNCNINLRK